MEKIQCSEELVWYIVLLGWTLCLKAKWLVILIISEKLFFAMKHNMIMGVTPGGERPGAILESCFSHFLINVIH